MKKDFYEILGISRNADAAEIKKAYRKKAIEFHPDKNPGDAVAEDNFKKAAEAYEILSDPQKKAKYDQYGHQAFENGGQGGGGFGGGHMNMDDIFSQFGDIFGGAFGGPQGAEIMQRLWFQGRAAVSCDLEGRHFSHGASFSNREE